MRGLVFSIGLAALALAAGSAVASASPQGPWDPPVQDLSAAGQNATQPRVTTGPDGAATAIWRRSNGTNNIIQAATRPPGGSFSSPVDLSAPGQSAFNPRIAIAADGTATVVWGRPDGIASVVQAATRPPGGSFSPPVDLSVPGQFVGSPWIATAADGTATVVWYRSNGTNKIIQAATRPPGGSFSPPVDLSAPGQDADAPQVVTAPDGTTTVVWQRSDGANAIIQARTRPSGGSFGTTDDLSAPGQTAQIPQVAASPDGTMTAVWFRADGTGSKIQAATRPPGGAFALPADLSAPGESALNPWIAVAPDGTATVVWQLLDGGSLSIQAATRPPGGSFAAPVDLSVGGANAFWPEVAAAADGTATAVWYRFDGSANQIIQSVSTERPSPLLQTNRTGTGTGTVSSDPAGIDCGSDCAENYPSFTEVTLTATPDTGSTFTGWSGADCSGTGSCEVTILEATTVSAEYSADEPPAGEPRFAKLKIRPKSKKVERGKKAVFRVRVRNIGDAPAKKLKLCAKGPKKLVRVPKCAKPGNLAVGRSKTVKVRVAVKKRAKKGRQARLTLTATANGARKMNGTATVKVK